jgi:hypothetical protein
MTTLLLSDYKECSVIAVGTVKSERLNCQKNLRGCLFFGFPHYFKLTILVSPKLRLGCGDALSDATSLFNVKVVLGRCSNTWRTIFQH